MKGEVKLQVHHGSEVQTNTKMDALRREECLCVNCTEINTCDWASALFGLCTESNLALAVTRCPNFDQAAE